jgi:hypothetical protein
LAFWDSKKEFSPMPRTYLLRKFHLTASIGLATLAFVLVNAPSATASWKFVTTGTTTAVGNPSCAQVSTKLVACAVESSTSTLLVNTFHGTSWGKWTSLVGTITSSPACTADGAGNVFCAANTSGGMLVSIFNGTAWSTPARVTGTLYSRPSCAEYLAGQVLCVARASTGGLEWSLYTGTWTKFATLATTAYSAPSCTTDGNDGVVCMVFSTGYATLANRFAAGKWQGFLNLGGVASGNPDCTSFDSDGQVVCYVEGWDGGIYGTRYVGGAWATASWTGYGDGMGGMVNDNAGCTAQGAGLQLCGAYAVGSSASGDDSFYVDIYNGSGWEGWTQVGGAGVGSPSCAPLGGGEVVCAIMQANNKLTSAVGP